jgi:hypothetical protein
MRDDGYIEKVKQDLLKDVAVIEEFRRTPGKNEGAVRPGSADSFLADYPWLGRRGGVQAC